MDFQLTEEQSMWRQSVHEFAAKEIRPHAAEWDRTATFPAEVFRKMAPLGLLGLVIPEELGGAGVDAIGASLAIEELGWADGGVALSVAAHNGLGCAPIAMFGSVEQKQRWLPRLSTGEKGLAALALTEPGGGSDLAGGVETVAERDGDEYVIRGSKAWITNPSVGWIVVTLCRTDRAAGRHGFSLIVVPLDAPGLTIHPPEHKMGVRSSPTHGLTYDNVRVPADHLLGKPGEGLHQTFQVLDGGRISIGALSIGLARAAHEEALRYATERRAFGAPLTQLEAIQFMLSDAATNIEAARWLVLQASWLKSLGRVHTKEAAMAKLFASEMAETVCRNAIQVLGSYGYSSEYPVERFYRDARLMTIGEGTSEVQRVVIARRLIEGAK
ncbi:MAG TPA: acyl-CoA dehydrogenase family protein [Anaerolineales bacterium]|nr:acyl-CoA dehydrogenase family protein [Anaerolineales bacterium]